MDCAIAKVSFGSFCCVFGDPHLWVQTKRMLCSACMVALLVYGLKCWLVLQRDEECLDSFHQRCIPASLVSLVGISSLYISIAS